MRRALHLPPTAGARPILRFLPTETRSRFPGTANPETTPIFMSNWSAPAAPCGSPPIRGRTSVPSWSRDGRWIAFLRQLADNEFSLIVIPALGGRERALLNLNTSYILGASKPAWSKDSKWLVISATIPGQNQQALARVSLESAQISWITQPDTASGLHDVMPALSPNGHRLAFSRVGGGFVTAAFVLPVSDGLVPAGEPRALDQGEIPALTPEWLNDDELIVATGGVQSTLWKNQRFGESAGAALVVPGTDVVQPASQSSHTPSGLRLQDAGHQHLDASPGGQDPDLRGARPDCCLHAVRCESAGLTRWKTGCVLFQSFRQVRDLDLGPGRS